MQVDWRLCLGAVVLLAVLAVALFHSAARVERRLKLIYEAVRPGAGPGPNAPKAPKALGLASLPPKAPPAFDV